MPAPPRSGGLAGATAQVNVTLHRIIRGPACRAAERSGTARADSEKDGDDAREAALLETLLTNERIENG